jgi:hypothetical protein
MYENSTGAKPESTRKGKRPPTFGWRLAATLIAVVKGHQWAALSPAAKAVYPVLWAHTNRSTWKAWPLIETIVEMSGLKRAAVYKGITQLEAAGLIHPVRRGREGRRAKLDGCIVIEQTWTKREGAKAAKSSTAVDASSSTTVDGQSTGVDDSSTRVEKSSTTVDYIEQKQSTQAIEHEQSQHTGGDGRTAAECVAAVPADAEEAGAGSRTQRIAGNMVSMFEAAEPVARGLILKHGVDRVAAVCKGVRAKVEAGETVGNPMGLVVNALKGGWTPSARQATTPAKLDPLTAFGGPICPMSDEELRRVLEGAAQLDSWTYEGDNALPADDDVDDAAMKIPGSDDRVELAAAA